MSVSDTEKFYTEVQEIILARFNKTFDWDLKAKMMGKKAIEAARVFVEETGISDSLTAEAFLVEREAMLQKLFPTSELMPGLVYATYAYSDFVIFTLHKNLNCMWFSFLDMYGVSLFGLLCS